MKECEGHGDCPECGGMLIEVDLDPNELQDLEAWVHEQLGECALTIGKVTKPIQGFERLVGEAKMLNIGAEITIVLGDEYTQDDLEEVTDMLAKVFRAYYIRTRLYDLMVHNGVSN
jgi:hypothetical protein